jgi:hypothetical protein
MSKGLAVMEINLKKYSSCYDVADIPINQSIKQIYIYIYIIQL